MEKIVRFAPKQKVTVDDANNIGLFARSGMDNLVFDAIVPSAKYAGATVTISGTTTVSVSVPLRLYLAGKVYGLDDPSQEPISVDFISLLPTSGFKKIVALTLTGSAQDSDTQERDFLVNPTTRETQAQPTATDNIRLAQVNTIGGASAVTPAPPAITVPHLLFCYVTLNPTGVESITQITANRLASIVDIDGRLQIVEVWKDLTQPIIDGMRSDIAKLQNQAGGTQSQLMTSYLLEQVARVSDYLHVSASATFSKSEWFLDTSDSDTTNSGYLAKVQEGLRFDDANITTSSPVLSNPSDTHFVVSGGLLLPAYNEVPLVSIVGKDSEVAISNAGSQTVSLVSRTVSKTRIRWGNTLDICTNSAMWQNGRYNAITNIFTAQSGETYSVEPQSLADALINHRMIRIDQFWVDTYDEIYWDQITTTNSLTGTVAAQTFLMPRAGWITSLDIGFSRVDTAGDVHVILAQVTASGAPDPTNVLTQVTVTRSNLKTYPTLTNIPIPATYAEAGTRLAVILITPGNHWLAMVNNNKYAQGTFFTSTDSAWFMGDITRDACFDVNVAAFQAPRVVIDLDPWNNDGGMTDIDMLLYQIAPDPTAISFEVKVSGVWYPIAAIPPGGTHPLYGLPASVNARMTMIGTTEVMPGIYLSKSKVSRSRPRTAGEHISLARTTPSAITQVQLISTLEGFDPAHHTCVGKLLVGGSYTTVVNATATVDTILPDGSTQRTWTFTGLTSTTHYKRRIDIGTDSALSTFHVATLTDVALP